MGLQIEQDAMTKSKALCTVGGTSVEENDVPSVPDPLTYVILLPRATSTTL